MTTTTDLSTLKINYLTQAQYDDALANNQINTNELYLTPVKSDVDELIVIDSNQPTSPSTKIWIKI